MSTSPGITLTGTITDVAGNGTPGKVTITLGNYGSTPPVVAGSSLLAATLITAVAASDGTFSVTFFGNYQISPAQTYYAISVCGASESNGTDGKYTFPTAGTFDLSTLNPLATTLVPFEPSSQLFNDEVVPSGTINSTDGVTGNATFTLPHTPIVSSINLFVNGLRQTRGIAFTISGATITYASSYIPISGSTHVCSYRYLS